MERNTNLDGLGQQMDCTEIPVFVSEELENFAPSMEVQAAEIRDVFMDIPELQFENWQNLDLNERVEVLQQLENEVAEIAHRPPLEITAAPLPDGVMGQCGLDGITISDRVLASNSYDMYRENLDTVFHEGRHAYQKYNIMLSYLTGEPVERNEVLVESWKDNLIEMGYEDGNWPGYEDIGFLHYLNQPIEVDARAFANEAMRALNI